MSDHNEPFGMPKRRLAILVTVVLVLGASLVYFIVAVRGNSGNGAPPAGASTPAGQASSASPGPQSTVSTSVAPPSTTTSTNASSVPPSNSATSAVPTSSLAAPTATGAPTVVPTKSIPTTEAPLREKEELGNGVTVQVTKVDKVKGVARGPGEVAGPALRVSVTVANQTDNTIPMNLALVNMYYGKDKTPAPMLSGPGAKPLMKPIAPDDKSTGIYVFGVPKDQRQTVMVEFSYTTSAPTVIFSGSA